MRVIQGSFIGWQPCAYEVLLCVILVFPALFSLPPSPRQPIDAILLPSASPNAPKPTLPPVCSVPLPPCCNVLFVSLLSLLPLPSLDFPAMQRNFKRLRFSFV